MFKLLALCSFVLIAISGNSQQMVRLKNGTSFELKKYKQLDNDMISFKTADGKELVVAGDSIDLVYDLKREEYQYFRKGEKYWYLLSAKIDGPVQWFVSGSNSQYGTVFSYYIGPGTHVKQVYPGLGGWLVEDIQPSIKNSPKAIAALEKMGDRIREKELDSVLRITNLDLFKIEPPKAPKSTVIFYLNGKEGDTATLTINDSETVLLKPFEAASVQIAVDVLTKVCITNGNQTYCDLIRSSPFQIWYMEWKLNGKGVPQGEWLKSRLASGRIQYYYKNKQALKQDK